MEVWKKMLATCLLISAVLLSAKTVSAEERGSVEYNGIQILTIGTDGTFVWNGNLFESDIPKGVSYDPENCVLTLNNAIIAATSGYGTEAGIWVEGSGKLKIHLIGHNVIAGSKMGIVSYADEVEITGDGTLDIQCLKAGYRGNDLTVKSGNINIVRTEREYDYFYGITVDYDGSHWYADQGADFNFLGGTISVICKEENYTDQPDEYHNDELLIGISAPWSNITVENAAINIDLEKAEEIYGMAMGYEEENDELQSGKLSFGNATIDCHISDCDYGSPLWFYEFVNSGDALFYMGDLGANYKAGFDQAFYSAPTEYSDGYASIYDYLTISSKEIPVNMEFYDVSDKEWYYEGIKDVFDRNIMVGIEPDIFGTFDEVSRAQFAVMLYRAEGKPEIEDKSTFPDVPRDSWYTDAVDWASKNGIIKGYATDLFGSADIITREQLATMIYRYAMYKGHDVTGQADLTKFTDSDKVSPFAQKAVSWAVNAKIISGKDSGTRLDPIGTTTRAECATMMMRYLGKYK